VAAVAAVLCGTTAASALPGASSPVRSNALPGLSPPVITSAPPSIGYGGSFVVGTPQAKDVAVVFLLPSGGSVPFPVPPQPDLELSILSRGPDSITVAEPSSPDTVAPGSYLLAVATPTVAGLLGSIPVPVTVLGGVPSNSPSSGAEGPTTPTGPPARPDSHPSGALAGRSPASGPRPTAGRSQPSTGNAEAEQSRIPTRRTDDRSPLARLPWLPLILLGAFALIARKLARLT